MPRDPRIDEFQRKIDTLEQQLQATREQPTPGPVSLPPPVPLPAAPPPPAPTLRGNLAAAGRELGAVATNTLGLAPFGLHPLGTAVITGQALGNMAVVGMNLYEREQERRLGTPQQRAERLYGKGIEARIKRRFR